MTETSGQPRPRLLRVYTLSGPHGRVCDDCGHEIRECFVVEVENTTRTVGSDCIRSVLGVDAFSTQRIWKRRLAAAKRQWTRNLPPHQENEGREEYINRRLTEMSNAARAWKAYTALRGFDGVLQEARKRVGKRGIHDDTTFGCYLCHTATPSCPRCLEKKTQRERYAAALEEEIEAITVDLETRYGAHRFDFWRRPAYRLP